MVFTNHLPFALGDIPDHPIGFYRPISYSLYPWLTWHLFGLNAWQYHVAQVALLALAGYLLYFLTRLFFSLIPALLVVIFWLVHSTRADVAYWVSSSQDILALIFFIATLVWYTWLRSKQSSAHHFLLLFFLFTLALLSKDFAVVLPIIVMLFEVYERYRSARRQPWLRWLYDTLLLLGPLVAAVGLYLAIRTVALGDPTLPHFTQTDHSYLLDFSFSTIAGNILVYSAWTAENWLWPHADTIGIMGFERWLSSLIPEVDLHGPLYPGAIFILAPLLALLPVFKNKNERLLMLLATLWWLLLLGPNLLMLNERSSRWLTGAAWGSSIIYIIFLLWIIPKKVRKPAQVLVLALLVLYGIWVSHSPLHLRHYESLSQDARSALEQYEAQRSKIIPQSVVYFVALPGEKRGTVSRELLLLHFDNVPANIQFVKEKPPKATESDVILVFSPV